MSFTVAAVTVYVMPGRNERRRAVPAQGQGDAISWLNQGMWYCVKSGF